MTSFAEAKRQFDDTLGKARVLAHSIVPVDGKPKVDIPIRNAKGERLEEYFKWQFVYALIYSGLYAKDYIGVEVRFPKGSKKSQPLRMDGAIFDDPAWLAHYTDYWKYRKSHDLEWLNAHLLAVIEFKRDDKEIEKVFSTQVKPAMKEKDPANAYVLGIYYDRERVYLFHRRDGLFLRYDEAKNQKKDASSAGDLSLHLPDPYGFIPSCDDLKSLVHRPTSFDPSQHGINDLDVITSIATTQVQTALSHVLRVLSEKGLFNQRGYQIFIEALALKIFDEKRNQKNPGRKLEFYVAQNEAQFANLADKAIQVFIERMNKLISEAEPQYQNILSYRAIDWKDLNQVRAVVAVCEAFQDFSFVRSATTDLYQLVFYNFANEFKRSESAQFLTPLPVIRFLVNIVNPRNGETILDPCCGIGDFLSLSFVHSREKTPALWIDDANIYGVDLDEDMIMLATLNMLLNGDGEATLFHQPDKGSILYKVAASSPPRLVELLPDHHKNGQWDDWPDKTKLMKFDVVLTNPPFGEDRAYRPKTAFDRKVIEMYETWGVAGSEGSIDLGIVFLENAYRSLRVEGRLGIVLSSSIASINRWRRVREWLMQRMRIVALIDLPPNVFAETGVNTTLVVAYKPKPEDLQQLNAHGYSIFVREISNIGYEKRTSKRNVFFNPVYKIDETTFEVQTDKEGSPIIDEDFTQAIATFGQWALGQEEVLQRLFVKEA